MARSAQRQTIPDGDMPRGAVSVHAGPPTQQTQPANQNPPQQPSGKDARQAFRDRIYKHRNQVQPWRLLLLPIPVMVVHWALGPRWWVLLAVAALGLLLGAAHWRRHTQPVFRVYALVCVASVTGWSEWAVKFGMWGPVGRYTPLFGLAAWLPLAWLWWERHTVRIRDPRPKPADAAEEDPFVAKWARDVEPHTKWRISDPQKVAAGTKYRLKLVPGQTIEDAEQKRRSIASYLGINRKRLTFETLADGPGDSGDESVITLIVTEPLNPHHEDQKWQGPTLDKTKGLYKHGVYPDSAAFMRLFKVENGIPHRACNGLWSGATGSGKSRGLAVKIAEHAMSGMFCNWYADGKEGASASELDGKVDWYAITVDECERMLRAAWKVMRVRMRLVRQLNQARFNGQDVIHMGAAGFPILQIILDEAQEFLRHKRIAKLVKALLRMGNEVGIGVDLVTQVPLLNELGAEAGDGGAEVIRSMAKSGNLGVYRAEDGFTGMVTVTNDLKVDPKSLPKEPGWCYLAGHTARGAKCKSFYVSKDDLYQWLANIPVITLDDPSARAAGEDYATRHARAQEADIDPDQVDLQDLDDELAILLDEKVPGEATPGTAANALTIKEAVLRAVEANGQPMKREEVIAAVAAHGKQASDSAVAQALGWWCERGHMERTGHGYYDLINRETQTEPVSEPAGLPA